MSSGNPDTRRRILEAAWRLLEETGGASVRMSDIARAADVSRQALYLHFADRAGLLIATTRHMDDIYGVRERLTPVRAAATGEERLHLFIDAWGGYLPLIQGVARALIAMRDTDAEARAAWSDRMAALREGCAAAIDALAAEGRLAEDWTTTTATDLLAAMLSFETWDQLTGERGWSERDYIERVQAQARRVFVS